MTQNFEIISLYFTWRTFSFMTTWYFCPFTANTFLASMLCMFDNPPTSLLYTTTAGLWTRRPFTPGRPLTIHWKNKWKFLHINIKLGFLSMYPVYYSKLIYLDSLVYDMLFLRCYRPCIPCRHFWQVLKNSFF